MLMIDNLRMGSLSQRARGILSCNVYQFDGAPVAAANVIVCPGGFAGTTGDDGYLSFTLPVGTYTVKASKGTAGVKLTGVVILANDTTSISLTILDATPQTMTCVGER